MLNISRYYTVPRVQQCATYATKPIRSAFSSTSFPSLVSRFSDIGSSLVNRLQITLPLRHTILTRAPTSTHILHKAATKSARPKPSLLGPTWRSNIKYPITQHTRLSVSTIHKRHYSQWDFRRQYGGFNYRQAMDYLPGPSALSGLIITNIAIYIMWLTAGSTTAGHKWMTDNWMVSASTWQSHPWTLLTSSVSHSSLLHLLFNMFAIGTIGRDIQQLLGGRAFLALCGATALAGSLGHLAWSTPRMPPNWTARSEVIPVFILPDGTPLLQSELEAYIKVHGEPKAEVRRIFISDDHVWQPALGASAIASGLFGMSAVLWPRKQFVVLIFTTHASRLLIYFTGFSVLSMLLNPEGRIGHAAHLSGLGVGVLAAILMRGRSLRGLVR